MTEKRKNEILERKIYYRTQTQTLITYHCPAPHSQANLLQAGLCGLSLGIRYVHTQSQVCRLQMWTNTPHLCV